jgi:uncharacterized protein (TIGR00106 family)
MTNKIIAELSLSPRSIGTISLSSSLKPALKLLSEQKGIIIETHAMGTNIEANSLDDLFNAVKVVHQYLIDRHLRVITSLKIDHRTDKENHTLEGKTKSISSNMS